MIVSRQQTLKHSVQAKGIGLHSGKSVSLCLLPAPENTGIVFRFGDTGDAVCIPALVDRVVDTAFCTRISSSDGAVCIGTIEHLLAAFYGLEVDNAYVEINDCEVPIMDGSADPFVFLIQSAGIIKQDADRDFIRLNQTVKVSRDDAYIIAEPSDSLHVFFEMSFDHPAFSKDNDALDIDFSKSSFVKEIARARTFGFLADFDRMKAANLALGASLDNTVVFDERQALNTLRFRDECVRHKILDVVGDFYLLGRPLLAKLHCYKSGHSLNIQCVREILKQVSDRAK